MEPWSLTKIWNDSLDTAVSDERAYEKRDYIWASELGGSFYDRYHKMNGRAPSTPPNMRSRRKFEAGNLIEWTVKQILVRAGVYRETQTHIVNTQYDMKVTGRIDFLAGGEIKEIDMNDLPERFGEVAITTINKLRELYPNGLREQILEVKSCSAIMFSAYEIAPGENHALQAFHYAHTTGLPALIVYICKDDLRTQEWLILPNDQKYLKLYKEDIQRMNETMQNGPTKEELLVWKDDKLRKNYKVEYSSYLDDYGYERPDIYADKAASVCSRINRVINRITEGKPMTAKNIEAIADTIAFCPSVADKLNSMKGVSA